jgi:ubiquitin-protein ligase
LKANSPGGVYLIPSLDDLRCFYGLIFVRRGLYTNGIFKFKLILPPEYNDINAHPKIFFTSDVYNPHVDPETLQLDVETAFPRWDPARHYLVTVLTFLKKIFYAKTVQTDARANPAAKLLSETDPALYHRHVDDCVRASQRDVFRHEEGSTAVFAEDALAHRVLRDLLRANVKDPSQVSKQVILSMIEKASNV